MKSVNKNVCVIGGGISGVFFAILLRKSINCKITIFERQNKILKKLLQTGNGMCNLSNEELDDPSVGVKSYNTDLILPTLEKFNLDKLIETMNSLGLMLTCDEDGRFYPFCKRAQSVADVLLNTLKRLDIKIEVDTEVIDIKKLSNKFVIDTNSVTTSEKKSYSFDNVICACGGKSSITFKNKIYQILIKNGLECSEFTPALVGFKLKENVKPLSGLRMKAKVTLITGNKKQDMGRGEVIFKDDGISGIVIMDTSRYFNKYKASKLELDLLPDYKVEDVKDMISAYYEKFFSLEDAICGIVPKMIAHDLASRSENIATLAYNMKHYLFNILDTYPFENSQVTRGGIKLSEVDINTYQSIKMKGLYIIGETLDVDGKCGGFNIHFALASAYSCYKSVLKSL